MSARGATLAAEGRRSGRSGGGSFPAYRKVRRRGGLHASHGLELAGLLNVKEFAAFAEDGESRNSLAQRNLVALGNVDILIHAPDIDVNEDVVGFQDGPVHRVMKVKIKNVAIGTPIAAEVQDDALVSRGRCGEGGRQVAFRLARLRVDVALGGTRGNYAQGDHEGEQCRCPACATASHEKPYLLTGSESTC